MNRNTLVTLALLLAVTSANAVSTINPPKPWLTTVGEWFEQAVKKPWNAGGRG